MKVLKLYIFRGEFKTINNAHTDSSFFDINTFKLNYHILNNQASYTIISNFPQPLPCYIGYAL